MTRHGALAASLPDARLVHRFQMASKIAALSAGLIGMAALAGWVLGVEKLKSIVPDQVTAKGNTAVAFILCSAAVLCLGAESAGRIRRRVGQVCASGVTLIGALTLIEYLFGLSLGIDLLLFYEAPGMIGTFSPGRMAPLSALNFTLLGIALVLLDGRRRQRVPACEFLTLGVLATSIVPALEYLFGITGFYELAALTQMAIPTTAAFLLVCASVLLARPDRGLMRVATSKTQGGIMWRRLVPVAIVIPPLLGWLRIIGERAGYYESAVGTLVMVSVLVVILGLLAWSYAISVDAQDAERKFHEEQMRVRQETLALALKAGHSGTFDWQFLENVVRWSAESEEVYGLATGGFGGRYEDWEPLVLSEDLDIPKAAIRQALKTGEYDSEFRIRRKNDGAIRWVHARGKVFFDATGRPVRMIGTNTDVTERKNAEQAAETERQKFSNILDNLPPYVVLLTPDYHVAFANQEFRQRFGASHGRRCYEFLFGRSEPCEVCHTFEVLKTGGPVSWKWTGPDGRNYDIYDFPFTDTDGSRLILEMGIDVTDQRRAEEALRSASLYARSLLEASLDPLVTINSAGKITDVNEATVSATGVPREKLIGSDFCDYFTEPDKARQGYQRVFEQGTVRDYPLAIRHVSGRIADVLYNASVYKNEAGEIQGVFAAARDVTQRKRAEEQWKLTFDTVSDSVMLLDAEFRIQRANRATLTLLGLKSDQVIGRHCYELIHQKNAPPEGCPLQHMRESGKEARADIEEPRLGRTFDVVAAPMQGTDSDCNLCVHVIRDITERKRIEAALQKSEEKFAKAFWSNPTVIAITDLDDGDRFVDVNEAFEKVTGYPRDEVIGRRVAETGIWVDAKKYQDVVESGLRDGRLPSTEFEFRRKNGEICVGLISAELIKLDGNVHAISATVDITEQKRAEEALSKARKAVETERQRFEAVLDGLPAMVCLLTPEHDVAFANRAFQKQFGECKSRKCYEYCFGKSEPCEFCESWQVLKTNAPHDWEVATSNGRRIHAFDSPFTDADGSPLILEMDLDVTDQRRAEEALRAASLYARRLLEASLDPLVTINSEGKITDVNEATELVTGVSRQKLIGSDFCDYFTEPEKARDGYKQVFQGGTVRDYPLVIRHVSGRITHVLYNASVYRNERGEVQGVFAAARDVTKHKNAEEALAEKAKELQRSNEELAQFAYVASHDLQEPLRKIGAFGDRLAAHCASSLNEQGRDYLERMQNAAKRMSELIESLLTLSRVTSRGRVPQLVDLNETVSDVLSDLEVQLQKTGGQVTVETLPTIMGDPLQMQQLFQNLIGNALKFHKEGVPPVIRIHATRSAKAWEIHVEDNGIGFEEQYVARIFRPFQRLHGRAVYEGSGMGLAICSKIVNGHAGMITAHSQPGVGSDFIVILPAMPTMAKEAKAS